MTMSDITYTVAVLESSYEVWDQKYNKKKILGQTGSCMESEDYTIKNPKYTDQKGKQREYCNMEWSNDGIEFYNEVRKRWRDIALLITVAYGQTLRELGPSTQRRIILETCTVERRQDKIFQAILLTMMTP